MKIFQVMKARSARRRRSDDRRTSPYERAALQIQVLVAVAAIDGEIRAAEYERLSAITERLATPLIKDRLESLFRMLIDVPPSEEDALHALISTPGHRSLSRTLVDDIHAVAHADGHIDPLEERLLRLLSAVGGGLPLSLSDAVAAPLSEDDEALLRRIAEEVAAGSPHAVDADGRFSDEHDPLADVA